MAKNILCQQKTNPAHNARYETMILADPKMKVVCDYLIPAELLAIQKTYVYHLNVG